MENGSKSHRAFAEKDGQERKFPVRFFISDLLLPQRRNQFLDLLKTGIQRVTGKTRISQFLA
jgi:hypothetical protein